MEVSPLLLSDGHSQVQGRAGDFLPLSWQVIRWDGTWMGRSAFFRCPAFLSQQNYKEEQCASASSVEILVHDG